MPTTIDNDTGRPINEPGNEPLGDAESFFDRLFERFASPAPVDRSVDFDPEVVAESAKKRLERQAKPREKSSHHQEPVPVTPRPLARLIASTIMYLSSTAGLSHVAAEIAAQEASIIELAKTAGPAWAFIAFVDILSERFPAVSALSLSSTITSLYIEMSKQVSVETASLYDIAEVVGLSTPLLFLSFSLLLKRFLNESEQVLLNGSALATGLFLILMINGDLIRETYMNEAMLAVATALIFIIRNIYDLGGEDEE